MTAKDYYEGAFNPEAEAVKDSLGCYDLRESAVASSHVIVTDPIFGAYHYDEYFEQKKLLNPNRVKGYRQRHDFILVNSVGGDVEIYLLELKSETDDFQHIRDQLQAGVALMSFLHRMGIDKTSDIVSFTGVKFYAAVLFHTKQLPETTNLTQIQKANEKRKGERQKYNNIPGVACVEGNKISLNDLRNHCKAITLDWNIRNDFPEFP